MPSPRAVLRDIHDLKLDPTQRHSDIKASGRLRKHADAPELLPVKEEKPAKPALVKLPEPPPPVPVVEVAPPPEPEVVVQVEVPAVDEAKAAPKKAEKPAKKPAEKKEKPEEPPVS